MGATVFHSLTATTPDDTNFEIRPTHWNSGHIVSIDTSLSAINISAGSISRNLSALTFSDGSGISWGINTNSVLTASVKTDYQTFGAYLTTAALSQDSSKYAGTSTGMTGGSVTLNTSGIAINLPAYLTTAMLSNAATISNIRISAGASSTNASAFTFADGSGVSWGYDGTNITATVRTNYQAAGAYLTTAALSQDSSKYAGTSTGMTGGSVTLNTSGIAINLPAYLTTAALSGDTSKYAQNWKLTGNSAGTQSSAIGTDLWLAGGQGITLSGSSNSVSFSVGSYITTAALSGDTSKYIQAWELDGNNTAGTTSSAQGTKLFFSGGNNITLSGNSNTIIFSAGNAAPSPVNFSAGATSGNLGSVVFSNSNNVSFGLSGSTITATASVVTSQFLAGLTNSGNTAGTTTIVDRNLYLVGTGGISLSQSADAANHSGTVTFSVVPEATISSYANFPGLINTSAATVGNFASVSMAAAFLLPLAGSFSFLRMPVLMTTLTTSGASSAANTSGQAGASSTVNVVVYSMATGANSASLSAVTSGSLGYSYSAKVSFLSAASNWSLTQGYTFGAFGANTQNITTQYSQTAASFTISTGFITNHTSLRWMDIPFAVSLTPGAYWLIAGILSTFSAAGAFTNGLTNPAVSYRSNYFVSQINSWFNAMGDTAGSSNGYLECGSFSTVGGGTTNALPLGNISSIANNPKIYFQLLRSA